MSRFYLIRHGQSEANLARVVSGASCDSPLTELGRAQARQLAPAIGELGIAQIYHSPLIRARDTAVLANTLAQWPLSEEYDLRSWELGEWEGLSHTAFAHKLQAGLAPKGGEGPSDVRRRVKDCVVRLLQATHRPFLIAAHAETFYGIQEGLQAQTDIDYVHNCRIIEFAKEHGLWFARYL